MAQTRTAQTIIDQALRSINAIATGETPTANERSEGLEALQDLISSLSAEGLIIPYLEEREEFTLTASDNYYTIGSGGDFNTTRPVEIVGATVKDSSADTEYLVTLIDSAAYRRISLKSNEGQVCYLYYNPKYALGEIYFYNTPDSADTLYLDSLKPLTEPSQLTDNMTFPEGFNRMLRFNLAVELSTEYPVPDEILTRVVGKAAQSKRVIERINAKWQAEAAVLEIMPITTSRDSILSYD